MERVSPRKLTCTSSPKCGGHVCSVRALMDGEEAWKGLPGSQLLSASVAAGEVCLLAARTCHSRAREGTASSVPPFSLCPLLQVMTRPKGMVTPWWPLGCPGGWQPGSLNSGGRPDRSVLCFLSITEHRGLSPRGSPGQGSVSAAAVSAAWKAPCAVVGSLVGEACLANGTAWRERTPGDQCTPLFAQRVLLHFLPS